MGGGTVLTLINIYAPNIDDTELFTTLCTRLYDLQPSTILWDGDFNILLDPIVDRSVVSSSQNRQSAKVL